jgi:hypothetical protein
MVNLIKDLRTEFNSPTLHISISVKPTAKPAITRLSELSKQSLTLAKEVMKFNTYVT